MRKLWLFFLFSAVAVAQTSNPAIVSVERLTPRNSVRVKAGCIIVKLFQHERTV